MAHSLLVQLVRRRQGNTEGNTTHFSADFFLFIIEAAEDHLVPNFITLLSDWSQVK